MKNLLLVVLLAFTVIGLSGCQASLDVDPPHHHSHQPHTHTIITTP